MFGLTPYDRGGKLSRADDFFDFYTPAFFDFAWPFTMLNNTGFRLDLRETGKEYIVEAELPGFKKEDITLDFDDGRLLISAAKKDVKKDGDGDYIHKERYWRSMQRSIYLKGASGENIRAKFENGVLEVTVPKTDYPEKNTRIEIQ